jgi:hypothetical protein
MLSRNQSTPIAIFFLALTVASLRFLLGFEINCGSYPIAYLGFGIFLEMFFLTIYFFFKTILVSRPIVARTSSRIVAGFTALPLSLITAILAILIRPSLMERRGIADFIAIAIVLLTLAMPTFLLWRYAFSFCRRAGKAERNVSYET